MSYGLSLGVGLSRRPSVLQSLASIVAPYNPLVVCEANNPTSLFQEHTATTPVTAAGQTVGTWRDQSGNGNHLVNSNSDRRPLFKVVNGYRCIEGDGVNDHLTKAFSVSQPWWRISVVEILTWSTSKRLFAATLGATAAGYLFSDTTEPRFAIYEGITLGYIDLTIGTKFIVTELHNTSSSSLQRNNDTAVTGAVGTAETDGLAVFSSNGIAPINARVYAVAMGSGALPANLATAKTYLAASCGVAL